MTAPDPRHVRAYGDTLGDGQIMLSFSLPVPFGETAREAARQLCRQMGLESPQVYHAHDLGEGFTYVVVYARSPHQVDTTQLRVTELAAPQLAHDTIVALAAQKFPRKIRVLGACTGDDAHTVGIDAILNIKGYHGDKGLESYACFQVRNLGAQVSNERLLAEAAAWQADVLLVSQIVTQKDCHRLNLAELVDLAEADGVRERLLLVCGGPRLSHAVALELGFDAGFGAGTLPSHVAGFIVQQLPALSPGA